MGLGLIALGILYHKVGYFRVWYGLLIMGSINRFKYICFNYDYYILLNCAEMEGFEPSKDY